MSSKFGNKQKFHGFGLKRRIKHVDRKGKVLYFDEVMIDSNVYWIHADSRLRDIGPGKVICQHSMSTYSDHTPMFGDIDVDGLTVRVCTFNACLTTFALRGAQQVYNADRGTIEERKWAGFVCGDRFRADVDRKRYVTDYINRELMAHCDILLLQEIDHESCEMLREAGINVVFESDTDPRRGGNAICVTREDITLQNITRIDDIWEYKGKSGAKFVGTCSDATIHDTHVAIASFHFDDATPFDIVLQCMHHPLSIVGGDFNKEINGVNALNNSTSRFAVITPRDARRESSYNPMYRRTIDGIILCESLDATCVEIPEVPQLEASIIQVEECGTKGNVPEKEEG